MANGKTPALMLLELVIPPSRTFAWRPALREALAPRVDAELLDDIVIATAELIANALEHGSGEVSLTASLLSLAGIRITVTDANPKRPVAEESDLDSIRGRGLTIVSALASEWGVDQKASGKSVWALFAVPSDGREASARYTGAGRVQDVG